MLHGAVSSGTFTIATSGANYTTLAAAEADLAATLISTITFSITEGFNDTTAVSFAGCVTYSTCPVIVQCTGAGRHAGKWSGTYYKLAPTTGNSLTITGAKHIILDGLQIGTTGTAIADGNTDANHYREIKNCILRGRNDKSTTQEGFVTYTDAVTERIIFANNIVYGCRTNGARGYCTASSTYIIVNNTIVESGEGGKAYNFSNEWGAGTTLNAYNNIAQEGAYQFDALPATSIHKTDRNVSEDASGTVGYRGQTPGFADKAAIDLSFSVTDPTCTARGLDLSTAPIAGYTALTTDISGQAWQHPPSIGAWEYIAPAPPASGYIRKSRVIPWE
jgi:hypothetical protein